MERIGIYGGTFNPPHAGHIQAAREAQKRLGLDRLFLVPDRIAPHKQLPQGSPSARQRYEMLCLAARALPDVEVSDLELRREGVSYTADTVEAFRQRYPEAELYLLMGTDMFLSFHTWYAPERILKCAALAVLYRGDRGEAEQIAAQKARLEAKGARILPVQNAVLQISSTDLRRMVALECAQPYLPDGVGEYIRANHLYGIGEYRNLSLTRLEQAVTQLLKPERVAHVLGCRDAAMELARRWGADETDAARAGLLHDITKALDARLQLTFCREYGIILDNFSDRNPKTLHALTGGAAAQRVFGENPAVVNAIRWHTTGRANMTLLEKILYLADYVEPNRAFPGVEELRQMAQCDLDRALAMGLENTLMLLQQQGSEICPATLEALQFLKQQGVPCAPRKE